MSKILQFKVTLQHTSPAIWRRFQVRDNKTFYDLHLIIQCVMGWYNSHLHQFVYGKNSLIGDTALDESDGLAEEKEIPLAEFFNMENMRLLYEYDFGDGWIHELVLEKILGDEKGRKFPVCIDGEKKCPPEDCGGLSGFYEMLKILKKKKGREYKEMNEWLGGKYDPDEFNIPEVNKNLKSYKDMDLGLD